MLEVYLHGGQRVGETHRRLFLLLTVSERKGVSNDMAARPSVFILVTSEPCSSAASVCAPTVCPLFQCSTSHRHRRLLADVHEIQ